MKPTVPVVLRVIFEIDEDGKNVLLDAGVDVALDESEFLVPGKDRVSVLPLLNSGVDGNEASSEEVDIGLPCVVGGGVEDGTF